MSWVRLPDWRIVASGRHVYGHKEVERLRVLAPPTSPSAQVEANGGTMMAARAEWTLQIKYASLEDQGLYECQVATATGIVTHYFNVSVVVPTTTIAGLGSGSLAASGEQQQREYHVDKGSAIQLSCLIHNVSALGCCDPPKLEPQPSFPRSSNDSRFSVHRARRFRRSHSSSFGTITTA